MNSTVSVQSAIYPPVGDPRVVLETERSHLRESDLASRWVMSPRTLKRWRMQGRGPTYLKIGKRVCYLLSTVQEYEKSTEHISTSERVKH